MLSLDEIKGQLHNSCSHSVPYTKRRHETQAEPVQKLITDGVISSNRWEEGLLKPGRWQVRYPYQETCQVDEGPSEVSVLPPWEYKVWVTTSPSGELTQTIHHPRLSKVAYPEVSGSCLSVHLGSQRASFLLSVPWLPAQIVSPGQPIGGGWSAFLLCTLF